MKRDIALVTKVRGAFTKVFKRGGGYMNPLRDWTIGLGIGVLLFVSGICYIVFDFYMQFGGITDEFPVEEQVVRYRVNEVRTYADEYTQKEATFNELRNSRTYVPPVVVEETGSTTETSSDETLAEEPLPE